MKDDPMTPPDNNRAAIRALLETLPRQQGSHADPTSDDLLHWVEGTLEPSRSTFVESALARTPALRHALTALRLGEEEPVPADELACLESLIDARAGKVVPFPPGYPGGPWRDWLATAAAVALLLAPAWTIGTNLAKQRTVIEVRELRESLQSDLHQGGRP